MTRKSFISALRRTGALAMILLAIMALMACPGKHKNYDDDDDEEEDETEVTGALQIDEEFLNSFDPDVPFEQTGHSRPFRIHPREDMTISAEAGAFEQDVQIRVTDVSAEKMNELDDMLEGSGTTMIFAYDLDAGLPPDSVIPGEYKVSIDLEKHDIPEELYPHFKMYRVASDGSLVPLNVQVNGHTATYMACQNSITLGAIALSVAQITAVVAFVGFTAAHYPSIMQTARHIADIGLWPSNWWKWNDAVYEYVKDEFGNFYVAYRYSSTENADKAQEYIKKKKELKELVDAMRKEGNERYDRQHPQRFRGWFDSKEEEEKRRIGREMEFYRLMANSQRVQELANDPVLQLPKSVDDIITATKLANRYCRTVQHMKPLSYEYVIWLTPSLEAWNEEACRWQLPIFDPCLILNYELIVDYMNHYYNKKDFWTTLTKIAHETMHLYQMEYVNCSLVKDDCYLEATGALVESHFTDWLIKTDKIPGMPVTNAFSQEAEEKMGYSKRVSKELLSTPLGKDCPAYKGIDRVKHERGYMMADMLQYLWDEHPNPSDTLDFSKMMNRYSANKGILKTMQDIFGINDDITMIKLYEGFCQKFISEIEQRQEMYRKKAAGDHLVLPNVQHDPSHCIMRVKGLGEKGSTTGQPYMVNTFRIEAKPADGRHGPADRDNYNLFAVASEKVQPREMKFTFFNAGNFTDIPAYCATDSAGFPPRYCYAAVMTRPDSKSVTMDDDYYYDIVALYQPETTPEVKGSSLDRKGLLVKPKCKPSEELKEKNYVTGLQIVMENNKSGHLVSYVDKVKEWKDEFVATYDRLGISDTTDIDVSMRSRWYYDTPRGQRYYSPATDIVNYKRQNARVQQTVEQDTTVVADEPDIEGADDTGIAATIDANFYLTEWGGEIPCPLEDETTFEGNREVRGHLTVRPDGSFSVMSSGFNYKLREKNSRNYMDYSFPAVYIDGKGEYVSSGQSVKINDMVIPPQTFQYNMGGILNNENGHASFRYRMISSNGAYLSVSLDNDGKLRSFELSIPDTRLSAAGSSGEESGQSDEVTRSFKLKGMKELPR